ncbi:hypothetical protein [Haliea salexigens]|uniref:hypothetical protein n=1 Tax=Haliea salexigens TaxID=287487 RepID=UPI001182EB35|nr:hypothetical protein [Haliea salexigens]
MKRIFVLSLFICIFISSCGLLPNFITRPTDYISYGSRIQADEYPHLLELSYKTFSVLEGEGEKEAEIRRTNFDSESVPDGGRIILTVFAPTIDSADAKFWEVRVEDLNGDILKRKEGKPSIPEFVIVHGSTFWFSTIIVDMREPMPEPFKVFVYDHITKQQSSFLITPA